MVGDGLKRSIDIVGAGLGLVVLAPVMAVVAVIVRAKLGSPVLFRQPRVGRNEEIFEVIKFRTMTDERGANGIARPDAERLTAFGRLLRSTSLDELPELVNVLRGEMSLVGPRPLLVHYLDRYKPHERRRHEVRPGLTGWAQVNGRNAASWDEQLDQDVWYVDNRTALLDLKIVLKTLLAVIRRSDITGAGEATRGELPAHR